MNSKALTLTGDLFFKLRFNTAHGDTDLYWRVIIDDEEYLVTSLRCLVFTHTDGSFDTRAGVIKYHIAGRCSEFYIDEEGSGTLR